MCGLAGGPIEVLRTRFRRTLGLDGSAVTGPLVMSVGGTLKPMSLRLRLPDAMLFCLGVSSGEDVGAWVRSCALGTENARFVTCVDCETDVSGGLNCLSLPASA